MNYSHVDLMAFAHHVKFVIVLTHAHAALTQSVK